ncbi:MAG: hypothetical protein QGH42_07065 [Kiritimatiellia bacterium]|nr:hypothetical protein [Kiritimatiellia bacterium]MDP6809338.1 hypothetical protein [Kiritimatiellia bacterium]MDP7023984.1 hypothetical protein [Kiritimatiellia bacterium]
MDSGGSIEQAEVGALGMFVGEFRHALDPKKRLTIPATWRALVAGPKSLYVLPDFHACCLNIFPAEAMARKLEKIRRHSMSDRKAMDFARRLGSVSELVPWDVQGRIRIKDKLLEFAGLKDQVVMIGALDRIELWSPEQQPAMEIDQDGLAEAGLYVDF